MIRGRNKEELDPKLIKSFSNEHLLYEESRMSRMTENDRATIKDLAFSEDAHKFYTTKDLAKYLRKCWYQSNFDSALKYEIFRRVNSVLVELCGVENKSERLKEAENSLNQIFDLIFYLGQSDANEFLHDENTGGWNHPNSLNG